MRILIAEDDSYSLLILRAMLEKEPGWQVLAAEDGTQAWALLQGPDPVDICIFDIMMPGLSGLQLATQMRADARFEGTPFIFCTALKDRATVAQAAGLAASYYITKPYVRENIIRQIRRVMTHQAAHSRIEAPARAAERLGLDAARVQGMLGKLQAELAVVARDMPTSPAGLLTPDFALRLNALKGAAANLGARRLAEELSALETARGSDTESLNVLKRIGAEAEHLKRYLAALPAPAAKVA